MPIIFLGKSEKVQQKSPDQASKARRKPRTEIQKHPSFFVPHMHAFHKIHLACLPSHLTKSTYQRPPQPALLPSSQSKCGHYSLTTHIPPLFSNHTHHTAVLFPQSHLRNQSFPFFERKKGHVTRTCGTALGTHLRYLQHRLASRAFGVISKPCRSVDL